MTGTEYSGVRYSSLASKTVHVISDQHGRLPEVPECDLLLIAGDITGGNRYGPRDGTDGKWWDWLNNEFAEWASRVPAKQIVAIAGNHDTCLEATYPPRIPRVTFLDGDCFAAEDFIIWGGPWSLPFGRLAFETTEREWHAKLERCPDHADIILVHGPPYMCGDRAGEKYLGSLALRRFIEEKRPLLVCCGHIHEDSGIHRIGDTVVINAACSGITIKP